MDKVVVAKAASYDGQVVELVMKEVLDELGGMSQFIKPGEKVLIKPNMVDGASSDKAVTTHPEVVTESPFCIESFFCLETQVFK